MKEEQLTVVNIPHRMLEHVREHGDPNKIIPFILRTHLDAVKKNIAEDHEYHTKIATTTALVLLFWFVIF